MTLSELRERLADLPDETLIMMGSGPMAMEIAGVVVDFIGEDDYPSVIRLLTLIELSEERDKASCPCGGNCTCTEE